MNENKSREFFGIKFDTLKSSLQEYTRKLSNRERVILSVTLVLLGIGAIYQIYVPLDEAFAKQSERIAAAEKDLENATIALSRYTGLKQRREAIENAYKEVEIKEGVLSHLEGILRTKAGLTPEKFTIRELATREFGGNYEQSSYSIKFGINDYGRLVDFLKEIVQGSRPLILASLDLKKRLTGESVDVELTVSNIRKVKDK